MFYFFTAPCLAYRNLCSLLLPAGMKVQREPQSAGGWIPAGLRGKQETDRCTDNMSGGEALGRTMEKGNRAGTEGVTVIDRNQGTEEGTSEQRPQRTGRTKWGCCPGTGHPSWREWWTCGSEWEWGGGYRVPTVSRYVAQIYVPAANRWSALSISRWNCI